MKSTQPLDELDTFLFRDYCLSLIAITVVLIVTKMRCCEILLLFLGILVSSALCASKDKPHGHKGALDHYNGKPIPFEITADQHKKLAGGDPVISIATQPPCCIIS